MRICKIACMLILLIQLLAGRVPAQAQTLTTLHSFNNLDGSTPYDNLIPGSDGAFYGTTVKGGSASAGTVFRMTPAGKINTLHAFTSADGLYPYAPLLQASNGAFYGTTTQGGANNGGTIFKISASGAFTVLHSFQPNVDGTYPYAALVEGSDGNFYGATAYGGAGTWGTLFKLSPAGDFTVLHAFNRAANDGARPVGALVPTSDGSFYGTTTFGGPSDAGTVFRLAPDGSFSLLHTFTGADGRWPTGLLLGSDGDFYGTTYNGGTNSTGTIYKITLAGALTSLYSFGILGSSDSCYPAAGLVEGSDGNFYGTTFGDTAYKLYGTLFKVTPAGALTTLYAFDGTDGEGPEGAMVFGKDGNLYGTTSTGGAGSEGTVFRLNVVPIITGLAPSRVNAGAPDFTLIVSGYGFTSTASVTWNGSSLATIPVSSTRLYAAVPHTLTASPGTAKIVVTCPGELDSAAKSFTVVYTTVNLIAATLTRNSTTGVITANLTLKNAGYLTSHSGTITLASLGKTRTSTTLPLSIGDIAPGTWKTTSLTFPGSAGAPGTLINLKINGTFTEVTFAGALRVALP